MVCFKVVVEERMINVVFLQRELIHFGSEIDQKIYKSLISWHCHNSSKTNHMILWYLEKKEIEKIKNYLFHTDIHKEIFDEFLMSPRKKSKQK